MSDDSVRQSVRTGRFVVYCARMVDVLGSQSNRWPVAATTLSPCAMIRASSVSLAGTSLTALLADSYPEKRASRSMSTRRASTAPSCHAADATIGTWICRLNRSDQPAHARRARATWTARQGPGASPTCRCARRLGPVHRRRTLLPGDVEVLAARRWSTRATRSCRLDKVWAARMPRLENDKIVMWSSQARPARRPPAHRRPNSCCGWRPIRYTDGIHMILSQCCNGAPGQLSSTQVTRRRVDREEVALVV